VRASFAAAAVTLAVAAAARAGDGERVALRGVPAAVTLPPGEWTRNTAAPKEGQWIVHLSAKDGSAVLEARVFPVKELRDPVHVLPQAIDLVVRSTGGEGFGMGSIATPDVGGRPAAETPVTAVFGGTAWRGSARLVLATDDVWAFAWGLAAEDAPAARREAARAFAATLVGTGPTFHEPRFRFEGLDVRVVEVPDEEPVTQGDLLAAEILVEAAREHRYALATRARLRESLLAAAREPERGAQVRDLLRQAGRAARAAEELTDAMRRNAYRLHAASLGRRLGTTVLAPHVSSPGERAEAETAALAEWAGFLTSLVLDAPDPPGGVVEVPASAFVLEEGASAGADWAAARQAWDEADAERRFRFRRAVLRALATSEEEAERIDAIRTREDLRAWYDRRTAPDPAALRKAAAALASADRRKLLDVLGAGDGGVRLGW
jgi:hypothetical protein